MILFHKYNVRKDSRVILNFTWKFHLDLYIDNGLIPHHATLLVYASFFENAAAVELFKSSTKSKNNKHQAGHDNFLNISYFISYYYLYLSRFQV